MEIGTRYIGSHVLLPLVVGIACFATVFKGGKKFVNAPKLCPEDVK